MSSKLILLEEGIIFEAVVPDNEAEPLCSNSVKVTSKRLDEIKTLLVKLCKPLNGAWIEMSREIEIDQAEVSLGINFLGEGNFFIAKAQSGTNLNIKIVFKPKSQF